MGTEFSTATIAQFVGHPPCKQKVLGPIPSLGSAFQHTHQQCLMIQICQTVEAELLKERVCYGHKITSRQSNCQRVEHWGFQMMQIWHVVCWKMSPPSRLDLVLHWLTEHSEGHCGHWILSCPSSSVGRASALKVQVLGSILSWGNVFYYTHKIST